MVEAGEEREDEGSLTMMIDIMTTTIIMEKEVIGVTRGIETIVILLILFLKGPCWICIWEGVSMGCNA